MASISLLSLYLAAGCYLLSLAFPKEENGTAEKIFFSAFFFHSISQAARGWVTGYFIFQGIIQGVFFLPWCMAASLLILRFQKKAFRMVSRGVVPAFLFTVFALLYPKAPTHYTMTQTLFSRVFLLTEVAAYSLFMLGGWFALAGLRGREEDDCWHGLITWGFVSYSAAQVSGAVWSYMGWGNLFSWTGRHITSATIWCFYAAYIHLRFLPAWNLRRRALFALAGSAVVFLMHYSGYFREMGFRWLKG